MSEKKYSMKQIISTLVGVPAIVLAIVSVNSEVLWLPVLCMSVVLAVMAWNGYFNEWLKSLFEFLRGLNV